jgi:hypothetical protein
MVTPADAGLGNPAAAQDRHGDTGGVDATITSAPVTRDIAATIDGPNDR